MPQKVVCVSMYASPLHIGHLELIAKAKALGNLLVVIVNSDEQLKQKYPNEEPFMSCRERMAMLRAIKGVDLVVKSIDTDRTVCKTLSCIQPHIFANGGDRSNDEIPESRICRELGIEIVDGLGLKIQSSSNLLRRNQKVSK